MQQAKPVAVSFPRQILDSIRRFQFRERSLPWAFLAAVILSYGIFIPLWGLYGDDWIYMWNYHVFGAGSFVDFVAVDRPFSAWIYILTTPIFGETSWPYHVLLLTLPLVERFSVVEDPASHLAEQRPADRLGGTDFCHLPWFSTAADCSAVHSAFCNT